ncbi:MAG: chorismate mutase [Rhodothermales bacterium]
MLIETVQELLAPLANGRPSTPPSPTMDDIGPWRECIDALDRAIMHMLNERVVCANAIGQIKKVNGMGVYDPRREERVIQNVLEHNHGPLTNEAARRLFERIIDESRAAERHTYQADANEPEE